MRRRHRRRAARRASRAGSGEADDPVVERRVPLGARLELIEEVEDDLGERQVRRPGLTRSSERKLMPPVCRGLSWQSSMIVPMYSFGVRMLARIVRPRISLMPFGSGMSLGLWTSTMSPLSISTGSHRRHCRHELEVVLALEPLADDVHVQQARGKPQRKPKPSASEFSGSQASAASFSESFSRASRKSG